MARTTLYSRSPRRAAAVQAGAGDPRPAMQAADAVLGWQTGSADAPLAQATTPAAVQAASRGWRATLLRHERWAWATGAMLLAAVAGWPAWQRPVTQPFSLEQIDAALRDSLVKEPLPAVTAAAYEAILPSVVRVVGLPAEPPVAGDADPSAKGRPGSGQNGAIGPKSPRPSRPAGPAGPEEDEPVSHGRSVGTGVVIVNSGLILTNLHVVQGAGRIKVTFFDGSESEATVVSTQPDNDLAVLQAKVLPDDLHAATLRSTQGLSPGDTVVAVGFPFGIGPSASAGVVSGLKREFRSPKGQRILTNLIQFDAAANPGNSGGPLVTQDGSVVGIVTAIMNPEGHSTFIGIGFAVPIENAAAAVGMPPF